MEFPDARLLPKTKIFVITEGKPSKFCLNIGSL